MQVNVDNVCFQIIMSVYACSMSLVPFFMPHRIRKPIDYVQVIEKGVFKRRKHLTLSERQLNKAKSDLLKVVLISSDFVFHSNKSLNLKRMYLNTNWT